MSRVLGQTRVVKVRIGKSGRKAKLIDKKVGREQKVLLKQEADETRSYTHHVDHHVVEREARQDPVAAQAVGHAAGE